MNWNKVLYVISGAGAVLGALATTGVLPASVAGVALAVGGVAGFLSKSPIDHAGLAAAAKAAGEAAKAASLAAQAEAARRAGP